MLQENGVVNARADVVAAHSRGWQRWGVLVAGELGHPLTLLFEILKMLDIQALQAFMRLLCAQTRPHQLCALLACLLCLA